MCPCTHVSWQVGTHFFFGLMELFGEGCVGRVRATVGFADGEEGAGAETAATGVLELGSGAGRLAGLLIDLEVCVYVRGCACVCACVQGAG